MTREHEASRRLVKSPPELWAECSEPSSLARHLGEFGEIKITRVEPETAVAWEGELASGTVRIEPSGWGTRVTLTALTESVEEVSGDVTEPADEVPEPEPVQEASDATSQETLEEPDPVVAADAGRLRSRWRRLTARVKATFTVPEPRVAAKPEPRPGVPAEPGLAPEREAPAEPELAHEAEVAAQAELPTEPEAPPGPEASLEDEVQLDPEAILVAALDSLGQAHHRPFSRA